MNQGLEALERLIDNKVFISLGRVQGKKQFANDINIIEKELKKYDQLREELNIALNLNQCQTVKEWVTLMQKKLKELEIIENKKVNMSLLAHMENYLDYNDHVARSRIYLQSYSECLTQEEFDFLKQETK